VLAVGKAFGPDSRSWPDPVALGEKRIRGDDVATGGSVVQDEAPPSDKERLPVYLKKMTVPSTSTGSRFAAS